MAEDPYKLLGVAKTASEGEIRKAYRSLAKKLHPDVNKDPKDAERFKKISAAYTLLSDKQMKAQYDRGQIDGSGQQQNPFGGGFGGARQRGANGQSGGFQGGGFDDMSDIFSSLFGMQMGGNRGGARLRPKAGGDIRYKLTIDFLEAINGTSKTVAIGAGGMGGAGKKLSLNIPEGTQHGTILRLKGKGQAGQHGGPPGDAKIDITVRSHKFFTRDGDIIRLDLPISLKEAVQGAKVTVPTPTGSVSVKVPKGSSSGKTLRLKGKGVSGGDLFAKLQIMLPEASLPALEGYLSENEALFSKNPRAALQG